MQYSFFLPALTIQYRGKRVIIGGTLITVVPDQIVLSEWVSTLYLLAGWVICRYKVFKINFS